MGAALFSWNRGGERKEGSEGGTDYMLVSGKATEKSEVGRG